MTDYRFLIVNENYLGHSTVQKLLCNALAADPEVAFDAIELNVPASFIERVERGLACLRAPGRWVQSQYLDLARLRFQWFVATLARRRVMEKLSQNTYDAVLFHTQTAALCCGDILECVPSLVSLDITNAQASREWNAPATRWTYALNIHMERRVLRRAAAVSTLSDWARRAVLTENPELPPEKVHHLPPGVELTPLLSLSRERTPSEKPRLLFVGGDFERKGGPQLLKCFTRHFSDRAELHLVTSADIPARPGVFVHRGVLPYSPEWLECYRQTDIFVLPTRNEAYGHVFIEAMAAGLPVVATDINAIPEIVRHDAEGLLVPPGDFEALRRALGTLLNNPEQRRAMGGRGRERAMAVFDADVCFRRYVDCLKAISRRTSPERSVSRP